MTSAHVHQPSPGLMVVTRQMTESERQSARTVPRPKRANAIGIAMMAMIMAVLVNFVEEPIALIMPLFFSFAALGLAIQARKSSGAVAGSLAKGSVTEVRGTPKWTRVGGTWSFGTFSVPRNRQLSGLLTDGVPARVAIIPEARCLLSVNGVVLKKPAALTAPPGFEGTLASYASTQPVIQNSTGPDDQELPPPPDDMSPSICSQCGKVISEDMMFCDKCGLRLRP